MAWKYYENKGGEITMKKILALVLSLFLMLPLVACSDDGDTIKADIPNNGEWDQILCSGDGYYLVEKEIDEYDGYSLSFGVVDENGEWVQELTDTGDFAEGVKDMIYDGLDEFGAADKFTDPSWYMYLGEGVFLASPETLVFDEIGQTQVGPPEDIPALSSGGGHVYLWNFKDNVQKEVLATRITTFNDGYALCYDEDSTVYQLKTVDKQGNVNTLSCQYLQNKPRHDFPIYSEGLFFANTMDNKPGFFDIQGNLIIDLSEYEMDDVSYTAYFNAPYFKDGKAEILIENEGGSIFKGTIDKNGKLVGEPEKVH